MGQPVVANRGGDPSGRPASAASDIDYPFPGGIGGPGEQRFADRLDHALETVELAEPARAGFTRPVVRGQRFAVPAGIVHHSPPSILSIEIRDRKSTRLNSSH